MTGVLVVAFLSESLAVTLEGKEPQRSPLVGDLPEIARIEGPGRTEFVIRGRVPQKVSDSFVIIARQMMKDVEERFRPAPGSKLSPVDVCLFENTDEYQDFLHRALGPDNHEGPLGVYWRYRRAVIANLSTPLGNLRHELAHALIADAFGHLPAWLDEGLASLYNEAIWLKNRYLFGQTHRLQQLRKARSDGKLPDFETLAASGEKEVYGKDYYIYYSLGRFISLYIDKQGRLGEFVQEMSTKRSADEQHKVLMRFVDLSDFLSWIDNL
jgi:hypothetical protein